MPVLPENYLTPGLPETLLTILPYYREIVAKYLSISLETFLPLLININIPDEPQKVTIILFPLCWSICTGNPSSNYISN